MKKSWILLAVIAVCALGCSNDSGGSLENSIGKDNIDPFKVNEPYTFSKVSNPDVWKTFKNLEEMFAACQLPEDYLKQVSTENLIATCMNYPLFFIYSAYNNELDGINVIMDNFNGFDELKKRDAAAEKIIDCYAAMEVETGNAVVPVKNSILHLGFLELLIASEKIPDMFSEQNAAKLEKAMSFRYQEKLRHPDVYSIFSVKKSLLLGAEVSLQRNTASNKDRELLRNFVKTGGNVDSQVYTEVSKVINIK
jgi:hypothetical protein